MDMEPIILNIKINTNPKRGIMRLPPIYFLPSWIGICSSTAFLALAIMLVAYHCPSRLVIGQIAQYFLSTAVWWYVSFTSSILHNCNQKVVVYCDRVTAVINIIMLASFYIDLDKIKWIPLLETLSFTVCFKIFDVFARAGKRVSVWYLFWHLNLFVNNATIICCNTVLPLYVMITQHIVALIITGIYSHIYHSAVILQIDTSFSLQLTRLSRIMINYKRLYIE